MSTFNEELARYEVAYAIGTRHGRYGARLTRCAMIERDGGVPPWWLGPSRHPWHRAVRLFDANVTGFLELDELDAHLATRGSTS